MQFFIPGTGNERDPEVLYSTLAAAAGCEPLPRNQRIYSIEFTHDGIDYLARVGERRHGTEWHKTRLGRPDDRRRPRRLPDSGGIVQAIFAGTPYVLWEVPGDWPSDWENPSLIGTPRSVTYFDDE
jgi:hypothetical protein